MLCSKLYCLKGFNLNPFSYKILHFEPSLDALSLRSDVISSIKILSLRRSLERRRRGAAVSGGVVDLATKWLPKWLGCEPRLIVVSLDS